MQAAAFHPPPRAPSQGLSLESVYKPHCLCVVLPNWRLCQGPALAVDACEPRGPSGKLQPSAGRFLRDLEQRNPLRGGGSKRIHRRAGAWQAGSRVGA